MAASISIVIEPVSVHIQAGGRASARVTLVNRGDTVGQYALSLSGVDATWCKLDNPQVGVFPSDRSAVQLAIHLPADVQSATYQVVIQAHNQLEIADQASASLALTVSRPADNPASLPATDQKPTTAAGATLSQGSAASAFQPTVIRAQPQAAVPPPPANAFGEVILKAASSSGQVQLVADRDGLKLAPGVNRSLHIALTNTGGVALSMELSVKGAPLSWLSFTPPSVVLAPGETQYATLTATLPPQTPLGSYPLTVLAQSGDDASLTTRINMMLEVIKAGEVNIELTPNQAQGELSGEYMLRVSQTGQAPISVNLTASDAGALLDFAFTPASVLVPSAGSVSSRLTVRPRQALTTSDSLSIAFEVSAASGSGNSASVSTHGRFVQQRSAPVKLLLQTEDVRDPASASFTVKMVNPGRSPVSYRLSASDAGGSCQYQFERPVFSIPANGEASTVLRVSPLAFLNAGELVHTLQISAQPASGQGTTLTGALRYIQTTGHPPTLTISPASQTSAGPASYWIQIANPRSVPLQIALQPYDPNQQCRFAIDPSTLSIPAQNQASARLDVQPLGQLLSGESRRVYPFSIAGYVDNNPTPIVADGTLLLVHGFTWRKLLPLFITAFVLLSLGTIAILAMLYMRFMQ